MIAHFNGHPEELPKLGTHTCKACQKRLIHIGVTPSGNRIALDLVPAERGHFYIIGFVDGEMRIDAAANAKGNDRRRTRLTPHVYTCEAR